MTSDIRHAGRQARLPRGIHRRRGRRCPTGTTAAQDANGLRLTAEGVENETQLSFLRRVGCHELQGYFMSRPVSAEEITRLRSGSEVLVSPLPGGEPVTTLRSAKTP
ncbi:MAG TPA: EAL domain-containing protein [Novosphingobium sp.]|nr:EAL domain-containing protein [Novosphingobium sp.]